MTFGKELDLLGYFEGSGATVISHEEVDFQLIWKWILAFIREYIKYIFIKKNCNLFILIKKINIFIQKIKNNRRKIIFLRQQKKLTKKKIKN